jgi:hypothetical protein
MWDSIVRAAEKLLESALNIDQDEQGISSSEFSPVFTIPVPSRACPKSTAKLPVNS